MKLRNADALILSTVIGLIAAIAAPWVEMRGTFAAWRIDEWHTFWRGDNAFMLADVVAANYRVPIEYATNAMPDGLRMISIIGGVLGAWHAIAFIALLIVLRRPHSSRAWIELAAIIIVAAIALSAFAWLFALPSSIATKVDFRTPTDIHTDTLIWSNADILPVAPALAIVAVIIQVIAIRRSQLTTRKIFFDRF